MFTCRRFFQTALLGLVLTGSLYAKPAQFVFPAEGGKVLFKAVGNPSALVINGKGTGAVGTLKISGEKAIEGELTFDLKTLDSGIGLRDRHMKNKYLEVEKFPEAKFTPTQVPWTDPSAAATQNLKAAPFTGKLSLHGVEIPVSGTVTTKAGSTGKLDCEFEFKIKLTDYKIEIPSFAEITVADTVDITVQSQVEVKSL